MESQLDLINATPLTFTVKAEPWNRYKLEDGTILFGKLVLTKILRTSQYDLAGQPMYVPSSQNLFSSHGPRKLKGTPTVSGPTPVDPTTVNTTTVEFENVGVEEWNVYELSDGTVFRAKLEVTGVLRTDRFGPDGDPFYIVNSTVIPRLKVPPELLKKQTPKVSVQPRGVYG